jgi:NTE family protein
MSKSSKRVSLVLGSGGARGLAHIGVLRWLAEHDYEVVNISGSSVGALVGGIYAAGKLDDFEKWVCAIRVGDILKLLDLSFSRDGMVRGEKIIETLRDLLGDCRIEELDIPFTAVATDLKREREVWLNKGSLFDAIRASISLPFFFKPAYIDDVMLLDGGILNPVPIAPTFGDESDLTIAVNLGGKPDPEFPFPKLAPEEDNDDPDLVQRVAEFLRNIAPTEQSKDGRYGVIEISDLMFDAMQGAIARQQLAAYPPDIELELPGNVCGTLEFDRAKEIIRIGYEAADRKIGASG